MFRPKNHLQTENKIIRNTHCNVMIAGDDFVFSLKMACKAAACRCWLITSRTVFRLDLYLFFKALYIYIYIFIYLFTQVAHGAHCRYKTSQNSLNIMSNWIQTQQYIESKNISFKDCSQLTISLFTAHCTLQSPFAQYRTPYCT